jgi:hypothetical protein
MRYRGLYGLYAGLGRHDEIYPFVLVNTQDWTYSHRSEKRNDSLVFAGVNINAVVVVTAESIDEML